MDIGLDRWQGHYTSPSSGGRRKPRPVAHRGRCDPAPVGVPRTLRALSIAHQDRPGPGEASSPDAGDSPVAKPLTDGQVAASDSRSCPVEPVSRLRAPISTSSADTLRGCAEATRRNCWVASGRRFTGRSKSLLSRRLSGRAHLAGARGYGLSWWHASLTLLLKSSSPPPLSSGLRAPRDSFGMPEPAHSLRDNNLGTNQLTGSGLFEVERNAHASVSFHSTPKLRGASDRFVARLHPLLRSRKSRWSDAP
jgi:hypothetical protein